MIDHIQDRRTSLAHFNRMQTDRQYALAHTRQRVKYWVSTIRAVRRAKTAQPYTDNEAKWFENNLRGAWRSYRLAALFAKSVRP